MGRVAARLCMLLWYALCFANVNVWASLRPPWEDGWEGRLGSNLKGALTVTELRHRDHPSSPLRPENATEEEVVQARYRRDAARVAQLQQKIISHHLQDNIGSSYDIIGWNKDGPDSFTATVDPGALDVGEYYVMMSTGDHSKLNTFTIDTASNLTWIQCAGCEEQCVPYWDPVDSPTFQPVACNDTMCKTYPHWHGCTSQYEGIQCSFRATHGSGIVAMGVFAHDTLGVGGHTYRNLLFGCALNVSQLGGPAGSLALGPGAFSFQYQIRSPVFFCLPSRNRAFEPQEGYIGFGFIEPPGRIDHVRYEAKAESLGYFLPVTNLSVGGTLLDVDPTLFSSPDNPGSLAGTILDTGTTFTRLNSTLYSAFRDAVIAAAQPLQQMAEPIMPFDTCYSFPDGNIPDSFPGAAFHFDGGGVMHLPPQNVLTPTTVHGNDTYCLAFKSTTGTNIIGNTQLSGILVDINIHTFRVGFSAC